MNRADCSAYPKYAASALASNDFVRALFGAGMPIAVDPMFKVTDTSLYKKACADETEPRDCVG